MKAYTIIAGVGAGTGASVARKFAQVHPSPTAPFHEPANLHVPRPPSSQTYPVFLLARHPKNYTSLVSEINGSGGTAVGISADVTDGESMKNAIAQIERDLPGGNLAAAVYNVGGKFVKKPFLEMGIDEFRAGYEANGIGAFHFSHFTLPLLLKATGIPHPATLIFTGATASLRGSAECSSFASGKFALRALAQSLAREFGPKRVHVAHLIVDGGIAGDAARKFFGEQGGDTGDRLISPEGIADAYWNLHTQPPSSFTFELDIRPYVEKW